MKMKKYKLEILLLLVLLTTCACSSDISTKVDNIKIADIKVPVANIEPIKVAPTTELSIKDFIKFTRKKEEVKVKNIVEKADTFETIVLSEINKNRKDYDAGPLVINELLNKSAVIKAQDMKEEGIFAHNWKGYPDTFKAPKEIKRVNNEVWTILGENLACNYKEPVELVEAWMNSEGHRKNLLNPLYFEMGIASNTLIDEDDRPCFNVILHLGG